MSYTYRGLQFSRRLSEDEKRSVSMTLRKFIPIGLTTPTHGVAEPTPVVRPERAGRVINLDSKRKTNAKQASFRRKMVDWAKTRDAGTFTCACGKVFSSEGEKKDGRWVSGARFHKQWTSDLDLYGEEEDHFIETLG